MNKEDIIRMAREAGFDYSGAELAWESVICTEELERFAALVASAERERLTEAAMKAAEKAVDAAMALEREACAKVCEEQMQGKSIWIEGARACSLAIRARGQA